MQLGKFLALGAEALIFREVPVKDIHLYGFHAIDVAFQNIERDEMTTHVDHPDAPWETRRALNCDGWVGECFWRNFDQLEKSLQAMHRAERGRRREARAV